MAALLAGGIAACGTTPYKGDTGIRPFAFDLWDVHCPSGLRVLFERAPGSTTAGATIVVGSGSTEDPPGLEGLAHLVEHLVFRGRDDKSVPLQGRLWEMGASNNAETDFDTTTFHAFLPDQSLRRLVQVLSDSLMNPLRGIDEATFLVERDVVRNELRERHETHSFGAAYQAAYAAAFPEGHPYRRPVGGSHDSLSRITLADAARFVAAHYRPENMTMVVVGNVDLTKAEDFARENLASRMYGDAQHARPISKPPTFALEPPALPPDATLRHARAPVTAPELWITWTMPGGAGRDHDIAGLWSALTFQNFYRGRLQDNDVAGVNLFAWPGVQGSTLICRVQLTDGKHPDESLRQVVAALPWIGGDEIYLETRFRQLKASLLRELAFDAESVISRSRRRAEYAHLTGNPSAYAALVEQIRSITEDQARDVAQRYLGPERARTVLVSPLGDDAPPAKPIPAARDLATIVKHEPLSQETLRNLGSVRHTDGLRVTKLDNGLDVVVLRRPGAPVVTATLAFHGDRASAATGLAGAAEEAIEFRLEESPGEYGISYRTEVGFDLSTSTVQAGTANVPRAFDMLQFGTRSLDLEWPSDKFREVRVPLLRRHEDSPQGRAERAFWKALLGDHPFAAWPLVDQIAGHKSGEIEDWLGRIVTPANGVLVVVGDVDPAEVEGAARDSLARLARSGPALPAPHAVRPVSRPLGVKTLDSANGFIVTHRPGASQAALSLGCLLPPVDARGEAADEVLARLVGDALENELRQRSGSTYGVHAWTSMLRGGTAMLQLEANIDNARLPLALASLRAFWQQAMRDGVSAEVVRAARDTMSANHMLRYDASSALARELVDLWNQGWPLSTLDEQPAYYASVGETQVNETLRVCGGNLLVALTGDEAVIRNAIAARKVLVRMPAEPTSAPPRAPTSGPGDAPPVSPAP
ncbi:MAG TPA: insulinase family protein [Polyangia bacterium]|nr:insulinase family protein [Polyangia bacterium]